MAEKQKEYTDEAKRNADAAATGATVDDSKA
jgi:hypothetical protein